MKRQLGSLYYKSPSRDKNVDRKRWGLLSFIARILRRACIVVGAVVLFALFMGILSSLLLAGRGSVKLPPEMVLSFRIERSLPENRMQSSFMDPFSRHSLTVHEVVEALKIATDDPRVRGLLVSLDAAGMELSHIQELRQALHVFRASGKFAHIYTASFADLGSGIGAYYLASVFDQIWMQPMGFVSVNGLSMDVPFAREALDKIGARPQFLQREEYKSAMESFTDKNMSEANRDALLAIMLDLARQLDADVTESRSLEAERFRALLDKGLLSGPEALEAGLIDRLDYADMLIRETRELLTGDPESEDMPLVKMADYHAAIKDRKSQRYSPRRPDVALVNISGQIVPGRYPEPGYATADYIAAALFEAAEDDAIKAVVVRVDSPGGSPTASETIRRAIVYAKEKGKKVIVSMGPVAASGGYWVVTDADYIFAMPSTLTGSIGVVMGKFDLSGLWEKLGINWDHLRWGSNAGMWSVNQPFTEGELERMNAAIDATYEGFVDRVAQGRDMNEADVRKIAKGRVWTGAQATQIGLVDGLGSLDDALEYAAREVGREGREDVNIVVMPKPLTPLEQFLMLMGQQVSVGQFLQSHMGILKTLEPVARDMRVFERGGAWQAYEGTARPVY